MSITPEQIRYFITACHYMNFTKAAEELHLTQPGLSKAIRELESQCGAVGAASQLPGPDPCRPGLPGTGPEVPGPV